MTSMLLVTGECLKVRGFADSARPDLIKKYKERGFNVSLAKKDVFIGINTVKSFKLHVTRRSTNLIKELDTYAWKVDKNGNTLDEPVKMGDDAVDALRYSITPYIKVQGKVKSFKVKLL